MHVMGLFIFLAAVAWLARPRRSNAMLHDACNNEVKSIPSGRFNETAELINNDSSENTARLYWILSGGVQGIKKQLGALRHVIKALQRCRELRLVTFKQAKRVWLYGLAQIFYSAIAIAEDRVGRWVKYESHINALTAARFHWKLTMLTLALCQVDGAPTDILGPNALL